MKNAITYPSFISTPATTLLGPKCYSSLLEHLDFNDLDCLKFAISKGLGIAIVAGGCIVKVPQIAIIWKSRSGRGVSLPAYILELVSCAINSVYSIRNNYAFSTYGENLFLTLQNAIITILIIHFQPLLSHRDSNAPKVLAGLISIGVSALALIALPMNTLTLLQGLTIPISAIAKVPQIIENEKSKSTGNLAPFTVIANMLGCFARVFTTLTEVKDPLVLWGFILASILNSVIGIQMWAYWGKNEPTMYRLPTLEGEKSSPIPADTPLGLQARSTSSNLVTEAAQRLTPPSYSPTTTSRVSPTPGSTPGRRWARKVD